MISESCALTPPLHASFTQTTTQLQTDAHFDVTWLTMHLLHTGAHGAEEKHKRINCFVTDDRRKQSESGMHLKSINSQMYKGPFKVIVQDF